MAGSLAAPNTVWALVGGAIFKSVDRGNTWTSAGGPTGAFALAVAQSNASIMLLAGTAGFHRSQDGGLTWQRLGVGQPDAISISPVDAQYMAYKYSGAVYVSANGGNSFAMACAGQPGTVLWHPTTANVLYIVGTYNVYKSSDGGATCQSITNNLPVALFSGVRAVAPSTPGTLYVEKYDGAGSTLYKTVDDGASWAATASLTAFGFLTDLVVDPANPSKLYLGTQNGAFVSTDSGANWIPYGAACGARFVSALMVDPVEIIASAPGICVGNLGSFTRPRNDLPLPAFSVVPSLATPGAAYTVTGSDLYALPGGSMSWSSGAVGLAANRVFAHPAVETTVFVLNPDDVLVSHDRGATFTAITPPGVTYFDSLAFHPGAPSTMYLGCGAGVLKTVDAGATWTSLYSGTSIGTVALQPGNPLTILAAPYTGGVRRSVDGGATWQNVTAGLDQSLSAVTFSPVNPARAFAHGYSGIYASTDAGASWARVGTLSGVSSLRAGIASDQHLFALAGSTLHLSVDGGATWNILFTGVKSVAAAPPGIWVGFTTQGIATWDGP